MEKSDEQSRARKILIFSSLGGSLFGAHACLLLLHYYAAWMVFNLVLGLFLIYAAWLMSGEKEP